MQLRARTPVGAASASSHRPQLPKLNVTRRDVLEASAGAALLLAGELLLPQLL